MATPFFQYWLRTRDADTARAFYRAVLGDEPPQTYPLHEQAVARGAVPHWLAFLHVPDVDQAAAAFAERGATPLAPKWTNPAGLEAAVIRDPGAFACEEGGTSVGALGDLAGRPGVHPHWLFHMRVSQLEAALTAVRAGGGRLVDTVALDAGALSGQTVAVCEDAQGAAFSLIA